MPGEAVKKNHRQKLFIQNDPYRSLLRISKGLIGDISNLKDQRVTRNCFA